jgi:VanZ family protein
MVFQKVVLVCRNRYWAFSVLLFWMAVIFSFSMLPGKEAVGALPLWYFIERKGAHIVEYAVLTLLAFNYFRLVFERESFQRVVLLSAMLALTYGVTDELHQAFVPFRGAKFSDVFIDGIGILLASLTLFFFRKKQ